jgi:hypothetical protein
MIVVTRVDLIHQQRFSRHPSAASWVALRVALGMSAQDAGYCGVGAPMNQIVAPRMLH